MTGLFALLDFLAGLIVFSLVTGLSYILVIVLLQELTVFPYRLQEVYCTSMGLLQHSLLKKDYEM